MKVIQRMGLVPTSGDDRYVENGYCVTHLRTSIVRWYRPRDEIKVKRAYPVAQ